MSFWYNVLQVVAFVLPHVIKLVDDLVNRYNGHLTNAQLAEVGSYVYDIGHIENIMKRLPSMDQTELSRAINSLRVGDLSTGIIIIESILRDYQAKTLSQPIKQSVLELFMGDSDPSLVTEWSLFQQSVISILPVAHMVYTSEMRDLGSKIWQLPMSYHDKELFMKYATAISLLENPKPITDKVGLSSGKNSPWICEKSLYTGDSASATWAVTYYVLNDKVKEDNGLRYITFTPKNSYFLYSQLKNLYYGVSEDPTIVEILTAKPKFDWVYFDVNVSKQRLVESLLMENSSAFRIIVDRMNNHISRYIPNHRPISDLSETLGMPTFIESSKDYIGDGFRYYLSRLKMMGLTYAIHISIAWSQLKNDRSYSGQSLLYDRDFESRSGPVSIPSLAFQNYHLRHKEGIWEGSSTGLYPRVPTPTYREDSSGQAD